VTVHQAVVTITPDGQTPVAIQDDVLVGATIHHGQGDLWDTADPSTLSLTVLDPTGSMRSLFDFTTRVAITVTGQVRFTGWVADMRATYDSPGWVLDVIAVNRWTALRTTVVPARPRETAADRILAVALEAGLTEDLLVDPVESVTLLAVADAATPYDLAASAAAHDLGLLAPTRAGGIRYHGRERLAASQLVKAVLPASGVFVDAVWTRAVGDLSTTVVAQYGTDNPQAFVAADDVALRDALGRADVYLIGDQYATQADAREAVDTALPRRTARMWHTETLTVDLAFPAFDPARTGNVLALEVGDVVWVTGAPAQSPAGETETYVVLGWTETLDGTSHTLDLAVAEYDLIRERARWGNVAMSWQNAGQAPVGSYAFTPPTLAPGVGA
jgi:hypothetical protein